MTETQAAELLYVAGRFYVLAERTFGLVVAYIVVRLMWNLIISNIVTFAKGRRA